MPWPCIRRCAAPLSEFAERFVAWMDSHDPHSTVLSSIGYDFRRVAGPLDAEPVLDAAVRRARHDRPSCARWPAGRSTSSRRPGSSATWSSRPRGPRRPPRHQARRHHDRKQPRARLGAALGGDEEGHDRASARRVAPSRRAVEPDGRDRAHRGVPLLVGRAPGPPGAAGGRGPARPDDFVDPATLGSFSRSGLKGGVPCDRPSAAATRHRGGRHPGPPMTISRGRGRCPSRGTRRRRG